VAAGGSAARAARDAIHPARARGIRAGLLRPITLWPFPVQAVREAADQAGTLLVAEMNLGQMICEVERAARGAADVRGVLRADGEPIAPEEILAALSHPRDARMAGDHAGARG
jgi:2-oxoglutarate ferredoxin oxidoreductase subunit alpha